MNTQRFIAAAAFALTAATVGSSFAGETTFQGTSSVSREAVVAELARARAAGELDQPGETYGMFRQREVASTVTRAEVMAELARARASGEAPLAGEDYASFNHPLRKDTATASTRTREEVREEARRAARDRSYDSNNVGG